MFLLVPAHPGFPGQIPQSRKTVVLCVCVTVTDFIFRGYYKVCKRVEIHLWLLVHDCSNGPHSANLSGSHVNYYQRMLDCAVWLGWGGRQLRLEQPRSY